MSAPLDRWAESAARRVLAWIAERLDPSYEPWGKALAAEVDDMHSGWSKLRWALSALTLAWSFRRPSTPRVAGTWSYAMNPRIALASLYRNRVDIAAVLTSLGLGLLVVFLIVWVMPPFRGMLASASVPMPLGARVVLGVCRSVEFQAASVVALLALLFKARKAGSDAPIRRALPVVNLICVVALIGLTSGIVGFLVNLRPVFRAVRPEAIGREAYGGAHTSPPASATSR